MADSNEELIGAIGVSVTGDYSSLAASYSSAQDQAATAGEAIADAFNSGVAGVADAADIVTDSLSGIGPAADDAGGSLEGFAGAAGDAGEAAETAGSRLTEMAEQMAAVGEALVITEGMRELGSEALTASDSITHAQIALTNLTGSGDTAKETIEALDQLGTSDGLAFPSLLQAGVRMQAILGPGADVVELLKGVADGAAVMGTDIETATTKFDQLATAGTASARTLTALGLSLGSLADAFNATQTGADATASSVATMFKALDQADRIEVLEAALSKLGGTAQQVAEQTFGGQWTQLANEWEAVMVQVGQALLPVISDLTAFTKTDILPFIEGLVSDFNTLPGPVKDVAVGVALLAATVIPVTGALAAAGLAVAGLSELSATAAPLLAALGIGVGEEAAAATAAVPVTEAAAVAITELGAASQVAGVEAEAAGLQYDLFAHEALAADWSAGAAQMELFATDTTAAGVAAESAGVAANIAATAFGTLIIGVTGVVLELKYLYDAWTQMQAAEALAKQSTDDAGQSAVNLSAKLQQLGVDTTALDLEYASTGNIKAYSEGLVALTTTSTAASTSTAKLTDQTSILLQIFSDATTAFSKASDGYQKGTVTAEQYEAAVDKLVTAQKKYNDAVDASAAPVLTLDQRVDQIVNGMGNLATSTDISNATLTAQNDRLPVLSNALVTAQEKLVLTAQAQQDLRKQVDAGTASQGDLVKAMSATETASTNVTKAQENYDGAVVAAATNAAKLADAIQSQELKALQDLAAAVGPAQAKFLGLYDAMAALAQTMPGFGVQTVAFSSGPIAGLQNAYDEATKKVAQFQAEMAAGQSVGQQYETALNKQLTDLVNLHVAQAEENTGLQGATDAYSLAVIAVAAAQAKYDTLNQAYQTNITLAPQVTAAAKALTDAHNALTTAAGNDKTATDALIDSQVKLYGAMGNLTTAAPGVVTGLNNIGTAAANATTQLNDVAAAVNGIEADMKSAFGSSSTQGGSFSTPAGEVYVGGLVTGAGEFGTESTAGAFYDTPAQSFKNALAAAQALMPAKGTSPTALAQDALAQAQAVLQVDTTYFGSGVGVTAQDLQTAQTAVTTAQAALAALEGGSSSGSLLYSGTYGSTPVGVTPIGSTGSVTTGASTTGSTTSATDSGTPITTSATGSGTGAIDGGSYPAVTAHQAAGETWFVTAGTSGSPVAGGSATITTDVANTISQTGDTSTGALSSISTAASGLVEQLATFTGDLLPISSSLASVASSVGQLVTAVSGGKINISVPGEVSSQAPATFAGTQTGSTAASGSITTIVGGGNPQGATSPITQAPPQTSIPGYNPFGPGSTVTPQVTINITGASNPNQMAAQVQTAVTAGIVAALRTAGARF